jgi:DNA-binding response OmpR family regulator
MKVLIVEDERVSREKLYGIMQEYAECHVAARGAEALGAFKKSWEQQSPYDIVTLDIGLGDISGTDVLVSMREMEEGMRIPPAKRVKVIMVTAHSDTNCVTACVTARCDGYIIKPFTRESIKKCLYEVYLEYINALFRE